MLSPTTSDDGLLTAFLSPASFWFPDRLVESAWIEHAPFAFWLIEATRPRVLVELGTAAGFSYAAFCQAIDRLGVGTRCYAVDTWAEEGNAGPAGEAVFGELRAYHDERYATFSQLLRSTFQDAASYFEDGSVDLLHLDGSHRYEDVRRDFEVWRTKLSDHAVVMFHDTNVRERGFGVFRLWNELHSGHPSFEFIHGRGLGVLAVGPRCPERVRRLCAMTDAEVETEVIRAAYARLGGAVRERLMAQHRIADSRARVGELERALAERTGAVREQQVLLTDQDRTISILQKKLAEIPQLREALNEANHDLAKNSRALNSAYQQLSQYKLQSQQLQHQLELTHNSTCWRITAPLRWNVVQSIYRAARAPFAFRPTATGTGSAVSPINALARRDSTIEADKATTGIWRPLFEAAEPRIRIVFLSGDPGTPGHLFRIERCAAAAAAAGAETVIVRVDELDAHLRTVQAAHIIFIWRTQWHDLLARAVAQARAERRTVIYDIDDLLFDPTLAKESIIDGIRSLGLDERETAESYSNILTAFANSDFGVAPTDFLAHRMRAYQKPVFTLPNGFDNRTLAAARAAVRARAARPADGVERIGYAAGTRTHQRDFGEVAGAVGAVLRMRPQARLVLFQEEGAPIVMPDEFAQLKEFKERIEWREAVTPAELPGEMARFSINLAPLELGNPFCEAKSELKYFDAALVEVPTIATPTEPFRQAIRDGETGFLASQEFEWVDAMMRLLDDATLRARMGRAAYHDVLWRYGPERRVQLVSSMIDQTWYRGSRGVRSFGTAFAQRAARSFSLPLIPQYRTVIARDNLKESQVTVIIPVYDYANYLTEALESVRAQTLADVDLVVVDDCSTDDSLSVAAAWIDKWAERFNRVVLLHNETNSGLSLTRNAGFASAETPFVLPLDADNCLLPACAAQCLQMIEHSNAAFVFPHIQEFGLRSDVIGCFDFDPLKFVSGNYIDALALIRKSAWAAVGGYDHIPFGWEDYDFWCKFVECGLWGERFPEILAKYRAHDQSMRHRQTDVRENKARLMEELERRHPWLRLHRAGEASDEQS
jgi:glycosyltransferase involved in cell wall biosynthesis